MFDILLALLAGILTIGAPCILPMLPIILGSSIGSTSKERPLFITLGFVLTFAGVALLFSFFTRVCGVQQGVLRTIAITLLFLFGISMIFPVLFERIMTHLSSVITRASTAGQKAGTGNWGGFVLGATLGIVWTPCAGPVLGTILTLIASSKDLVRASILLIAYAIGAGIPMLIIAYGGSYITRKVRVLANYTRIIQQVFGVIIVLLAVLMIFNYDVLIQAKLLELYPGGRLLL